MSDYLHVYVFTARGRQDTREERQAVGIGACVLDGSDNRLFQGYGYASDAEFPRAYAVHRLLEHFPDRKLKVYTEGLRLRQRQFQEGGGKTAKGKPFVGHEHLEALQMATPRLMVLKVPPGFIPEYLSAKRAARAALAEVEAHPQSKNYVPVIISSNHILDFKEVPEWQDTRGSQ